ncbi:MAG: ATP-binding protein [Actinomycetota bacterium]
MTYSRPMLSVVVRRLKEPRRFIQVLAGPRQVGKTTLIRQAMDVVDLSAHYASADDPAGRDLAWLRSQWEIGRLTARDGGRKGGLLVLDEIQKIPEWASLTKLLWDEDSGSNVPLRVVILGSAPLLIQRGLGEALTGRFELIRVPHWSLPEMREAFGWDLDRYVFFGGYPGGAALVKDPRRWARYVMDSLVETTISRDILLLTRVDKPALLRQMFRLACEYSGQILSYQKMVGQLQDAGNTTTLAHYLELLGGAGLVTGLQKFSSGTVRMRGSSPKLLALNTALVSAPTGLTFREARRDTALWGRLVETAVGAHLVNTGAEDGIAVMYWRDRDREVDWVLERGPKVMGIEVTSSRRKGSVPGLRLFQERSGASTLLVGGQGIPVEDFLARPAVEWLP